VLFICSYTNTSNDEDDAYGIMYLYLKIDCKLCGTGIDSSVGVLLTTLHHNYCDNSKYPKILVLVSLVRVGSYIYIYGKSRFEKIFKTRDSEILDSTQVHSFF
jgi:hypothetical protein